MTTLQQLIDEMKARCEKATPGPWILDKSDWAMIHPPYQKVGEDHPPVTGYESIDRKPDAEFIAHARTDMPRVLKALEACVRQRNIEIRSNDSGTAGAIEYYDGKILAILSGANEKSGEVGG